MVTAATSGVQPPAWAQWPEVPSPSNKLVADDVITAASLNTINHNHSVSSVQPPQSPIQCRLSPECELLGAFHIDIGLLRDSQLGQGQQPGSCTIVTLQLHLSVAIALLCVKYIHI